MFGLKDFDDKYPIGSIERTRIENNRLAEDRNTPKGMRHLVLNEIFL